MFGFRKTSGLLFVGCGLFLMACDFAGPSEEVGTWEIAGFDMDGLTGVMPGQSPVPGGPHAMCGPDAIDIGQAIAIEISEAEPNASAYLVRGQHGGAGCIQGVYCFDVGNPRSMWQGTTDTNGKATVLLNIPNQPNLTGKTLAMQSMVLSGGVSSLSNVVVRVLGDGPVTDATCDDSGNTTHDVVVVGAGSAGLYAGKTLIEHGYDVLIIEATDRIGGRVKSETLGDMRVELGAEEHYLAAGNNPVWSAIRDEYGNSIYVNAYQGLDAYSMDGGTNTCWTTNSALNSCNDDSDVTGVDPFWNWYWAPNQHPDPATSLADDVLDEYGVGSAHRAYHLYDAGFAGAYFATTLDRLGARSLALQDFEWDLSGDIRAIGDKDLGYSDALETVWWNDVLANSDLLLSSPVTMIDTSGDDVIITDANGVLHAARQVIVTVSIGVLQAEMIDFVPDLPASTVSAYNGIGIDMGMKVPMSFSSAWWETEGDALAWLVTEGLAGACWVPSDYKVGSTSHILLCYPMGDNAAALNDLAIAAGGGAAGDAAIINAILADLDGTFPQAPGQASANYIEGIVQNWGAAPYTLGAYSYPMVGTYTTANDSKRRDLQDAVADDRIFFAGEGSHETHPSTVVGALHEGERAADDVHAVNGAPNTPPALP